MKRLWLLAMLMSEKVETISSGVNKEHGRIAKWWSERIN
jgi:hypothetical protein